MRNAAISESRARTRRTRRDRSAWAGSEVFALASDALIDREAVAAAIAPLSDEEREIVVLRVWGELSLDEIAGVTGLSTPTVHRRYSGALTHIRTALEMSCSTKKT